jgi:hypothetical protein
VRLVPRYHLGSDHAFFLRLVREQLSANCVSDRINVRQIRAKLAINLNLTALAQLEAERSHVDSGQRWFATN